MTAQKQSTTQAKAEHVAAPPATLAEALVTIQARLPVIKKDERAVVTHDKGTYSYRYSNLASITEQIRPLMVEMGLAFSARPTMDDAGRFVLAWELLHISGDAKTGTYPLSGNTQQAIGSAITYGRRYCLTAVLNITLEEDDDDAAAAQAHGGQPGVKVPTPMDMAIAKLNAATQRWALDPTEVAKKFFDKYGKAVRDADAQTVETFIYDVDTELEANMRQDGNSYGS